MIKPRRSRENERSDRKVVRCAIYTRKSTAEGLDQDFNSLDAQRESAEAYIRSQAHEGWRLESTGFSISRDQISMSVWFSIAGARRARHRAASDVRRHEPARAPIRLNTSGHQPRSTQNLSAPAACTRSKRPRAGIRQRPALGPS